MNLAELEAVENKKGFNKTQSSYSFHLGAKIDPWQYWHLCVIGQMEQKGVHMRLGDLILIMKRKGLPLSPGGWERTERQLSHRSFFSGTASKKKISFWFFLEKFVKRLIFTSDQTEGICNARVHACMLSCFSRSRPFWDPMDCSPPGSSLHGILQARTLEWVAMPSTRRSSQPRNRNHVFYVSCIFRWILYH